jgi:predicted Zn-dependent peptidase
LSDRLRGELGLCYYIGSAASSGSDSGVFYISAGLAKDRLDEALREIVSELNKIKNELLTDEELARVKKKFSASMRLALETSDSYADYYGFQELFGLKVKEIEEKIAIFEKITAKQIQAVAKQIFTAKNANLAIVGPYKDDSSFMKILRDL